MAKAKRRRVRQMLLILVPGSAARAMGLKGHWRDYATAVIERDTFDRYNVLKSRCTQTMTGTIQPTAISALKHNLSGRFKRMKVARVPKQPRLKLDDPLVENWPKQLGLRTRRAAARLGVETLRDFTKFSAEQLLALPSYGDESLQELRRFLQRRGLKLYGE